MGIDTKDKKKNGDEDKTGNYDGGTYTIVCNEPTTGAEDGGRTAMENCLSINPNTNVVFTANETSGVGAVQALKASGVKNAWWFRSTAAAAASKPSPTATSAHSLSNTRVRWVGSV